MKHTPSWLEFYPKIKVHRIGICEEAHLTMSTLKWSTFTLSLVLSAAGL